MEEHWRTDDTGALKGLFVVKGEHARGSDYWAKVEEVIAAYGKLHPQEMQLQHRQNKARQSEQLNDYGSNRAKNIRWGLSLPVGLMMALQRLDPVLFEDAIKVNHFMRKFPALRVCKTA